VSIPNPHRPTKAELLAAKDKSIPDVIAPDLRVLFCGINPGLYTAAIGHHFGRPGNRFWPALYASGFTDRLLSPYEEQELLALPGRIESLEAEQQRLQAAVASPDFYKEPADAIARTLSRLEAIEQELLEVLSRWDELDSLTKR